MSFNNQIDDDHASRVPGVAYRCSHAVETPFRPHAPANGCFHKAVAERPHVLAIYYSNPARRPQREGSQRQKKTTRTWSKLKGDNLTFLIRFSPDCVRYATFGPLRKISPRVCIVQIGLHSGTGHITRST